MHAYSINGTLIVGTKDRLEATAELSPGEFRRDGDGAVVGIHQGGSRIHWDTQKTVMERGERMWIDDQGDEWPECAVILVEKELDIVDDEDDPAYGEMRELPTEDVARATVAYERWLSSDPKAVPIDSSRRFIIEMPEGGWRAKDSFSAEEKARLRPAAEILALLDGNAFFGMDVDADGDDRHYENYLPEAAAIAEANNGWYDLTSFARAGRPLPENPMGLDLSERVEGRVDLASGNLMTVRVTGIVWDTSGDDDAADATMIEGTDLSPLLPADLVVGVPRDWEEDGRLVSLLSDHYGFCILSIGATEPVED